MEGTRKMMKIVILASQMQIRSRGHWQNYSKMVNLSPGGILQSPRGFKNIDPASHLQSFRFNWNWMGPGLEIFLSSDD